MDKTSMTLEQVQVYLDSLPSDVDDRQRRRIAKTLGHELPKPPVKAISEQLSAVQIVRGHVPKRAKPGTPGRDYVAIPTLELEDGTTVRGAWIRLDIASDVGQCLIDTASKA
jgi:hypothetical protein